MERKKKQMYNNLSQNLLYTVATVREKSKKTCKILSYPYNIEFKK